MTNEELEKLREQMTTEDWNQLIPMLEVIRDELKVLADRVLKDYPEIALRNAGSLSGAGDEGQLWLGGTRFEGIERHLRMLTALRSRRDLTLDRSWALAA